MAILLGAAAGDAAPTSSTASTPLCSSTTSRPSSSTSASSRSSRCSSLAEVLLAFYLQQRLVIRWRVWLNDRRPARLARRPRLSPRPLHRRLRWTTPTSASRKTSSSLPQDSVTLAVGAVTALMQPGVLHDHPVGAVRAVDAVRRGDPPRDDVQRLPLRDHRLGHRVPDRSPADQVELPAGAVQRLVPLRAGAAARQLREHRVPPRRGGGAGRVARAVRPGDRQRLGDRVPEPEVPGLQPGDHPVLADHPAGHPGPALLRPADHVGRHPADRVRVQPGP